MKSSLRLAVAQPPVSGGEEWGKLEVAKALIRQAGESGVELVCFPESYPGPIRVDSDYDAEPAIAYAAREADCAVCWGRVERDADGRHRTIAYLHDADGERAGRYERSHPATGDVHPVLSGVGMAPGAGGGPFDIGGVRVGVLVCSELWLPEIARGLALAGAEILLAPAGGGFGPVAANWQLIARARAIENQCYVALTQALFDAERGAALIAGPERVQAECEHPGIAVADCDLNRARWLRAHDDSMAEPKPFESLPGLLRARRPELYGALIEPRENLYDYEAAAPPEA